MKLITYCDLYENENYKLLQNTCNQLKINFINTHNNNIPWSGFFNRWIYIYDYIKNISDDENIGVIDGTDVFILKSLFDVEKNISYGKILVKKHEYNFLLQNTCNINAGIFFGKAKDIKDLCKFFINTSENDKKFFLDCDQSYLNFKINTNKLSIKFEDCEFIYMNSFLGNIDEKTCIYHAIGMNDIFSFKTRKNIKRYFNLDFKINLLYKRYINYVLKWLLIEIKILLNK